VVASSGEDGRRLLGQQLLLDGDSSGIGGEALRHGKAVVLPTTWCEAGRASRRELALSDRVRSAAAVPVLVRGNVAGLLVIHGSRDRQFSSEHGELLDHFAEESAGPLDSAVLALGLRRLEEVERADRMKSEFVAAAADEIRGPLRPMLDWTSKLLSEDLSREDTETLLQQLYDGTMHLSLLTNNLFDVARAESGRLRTNTESLDLSELLQSTVLEWREKAPEHQLVLAVPSRLELEGDRALLREALDRLLSNAVKYSRPGSRVFISARLERDERVMIRISDQGLGLTAEECERVFAKLYRTEAARRHASGTGLGLARCKQIVLAHAGEIRAESEGPGFGSAFVVKLPTHRETMSLQSSRRPSPVAVCARA
jgi:signal transduction histidine kinase